MSIEKYRTLKNVGFHWLLCFNKLASVKGRVEKKLGIGRSFFQRTLFIQYNLPLSPYSAMWLHQHSIIVISFCLSSSVFLLLFIFKAKFFFPENTKNMQYNRWYIYRNCNRDLRDLFCLTVLSGNEHTL